MSNLRELDELLDDPHFIAGYIEQAKSEGIALAPGLSALFFEDDGGFWGARILADGEVFATFEGYHSVEELFRALSAMYI